MRQELPVSGSRQPLHGAAPADFAGSAARLAAAVGRLNVRHRPTPGSTDPLAGAGEGFSIPTCQRIVDIWLGEPGPLPGEARRPGLGERHPRHESDQSAETHRGDAAYRFLLEFAAGLKSALPGETNVFGQVRDAWGVYRKRSQAAGSLSPVMDALLRDVREIRTRHLQGIGGQSYATLARRLLAPGAGARVLIVGYGELGRSMPQKFSRAELAVFSRTLPETLPGAAVRSFSSGDELVAATWATHVVICVPRNPIFDARWVAALRGRDVRVAHLACRRDERGAWEQIAGLIDLDHLFALQRSQSELRTGQLQAAHRTCAELAARAVSGALI